MRIARPTSRAAKTPNQSAGKAAPENAPTTPQKDRPNWTFLTNHSHVLICLWRQPDLRLRDVAEQVGITERAVQAIVADLEEADVLTRTREGRRNRYDIHDGVHLRHPLEADRSVRELLDTVGREVPKLEPTS